tara:strand:- start:148 stop:414 length:267 start_codon:yes stop_codon:yes gene_type:complete
MKKNKLLDEHRHKINLIDYQIVSLIDERMNIASNIGKIKQKDNIRIFNKNREREILTNLKQKSKYLSYNEIEKIYEIIFEISKKNQLK